MWHTVLTAQDEEISQTAIYWLTKNSNSLQVSNEHSHLNVINISTKIRLEFRVHNVHVLLRIALLTLKNKLQ